MSAPVLTVGPDDSLRDLLQLLEAYPVHHVPVVKEDRVIGLVSSADILKFRHFLPQQAQARAAALEWHVDRIMQSPVITVAEHASAQHAAELMVTHAIHCVPVVNAADHLIGIVTTTDIMDACLRSTAESATTGTATTDDVRAVAAAQRAVDSNSDPQGVAAALLREHARLAALEHVLHAARRYLNAGMDEQLHTALRVAIDRVDRMAAAQL